MDSASTKVIAVVAPIIVAHGSYLDPATLLRDLREGKIVADLVNKDAIMAMLLMGQGQSPELKGLVDEIGARGGPRAALADWIWVTAGEQQE